MKITTITLAAPLILLVGCVTTATAEQRASCEEMKSTMATGTTHDHAELKGGARSSMNLTHECREILAQKS